MSSRPRISEVDINIRIEDLLGPLGYSDMENVQPSIMDRITSESGRCVDLMTGKAIYSCLEFSRIDGRNAIEIDGKIIDDETLIGSLDGAKAQGIIWWA